MTRTERIKEIQRSIGAVADGVIGNETLTKFQCKYGIPSKAMVALFFGTIAHESGDFTIVEESGMYSAERLRAIFPKYFPTMEMAKQYAYKPEKIFNLTYGGRMGNNMPGDGYKFRGRGFMQTTGKYSYDRLGKFLGVDLIKNPNLVATKYPLESSIFYFTDNKLWGLVNDISEESIRLIRKRVNGGYNGLDDVRNKVKKYYNLMK